MPKQPSSSRHVANWLLEGVRTAASAIRDRITGRKRKYFQLFADGIWYYLVFGPANAHGELGPQWVLQKYSGILSTANDAYAKGSPAEAASAVAASVVLTCEIDSLTPEDRIQLKERVLAAHPLSTEPVPVDISSAFWGAARECDGVLHSTDWPPDFAGRVREPLVRAVLVFRRNFPMQMARNQGEDASRAPLLDTAFKNVWTAVMDPASTRTTRAATRLADHFVELGGDVEEALRRFVRSGSPPARA